MMKKSVFTVMICTAAACCFAGCEIGDETQSSKAPNANSSYYSVNYTDTGDAASSFGNSKANVDHSSPVSSAIEEYESSSEEKTSSVDVRRVSSRKSNASSRPTTTKTTVTYYYTDEDGEHATDTEVYISEDTDITELQSSLTSSHETETDTSEHTDSDTDWQSESSSEPSYPLGLFEESDLVFEYGGASIYYGCNIDDVTAVLGEPLHIDNIPNADNPEFDKKTYNYEYFSIDVVPSDDGSVYTVAATQIFDDDIYTAKGVNIGMTTLEAVRKYGTDFMICDDEYRYYIGNRYMYFYVQNGVVANIGYGCDEDITFD